MDITPLVPDGVKRIQSYGDFRFRVSGEVHEGSILVFPGRVLAWDVTRFEDITYELLAPVVAPGEGVDVLLLGCGGQVTIPLAKDVQRRLREQGIVVEVMNTGAAARTYNVLVAEGRRIVAALIAVE